MTIQLLDDLAKRYLGAVDDIGNPEPLRDNMKGAFLQAVEAMRRRVIGKGSLCADCGQQIPAKRLEAHPEATRCITCQTKKEGRKID